MSYLKDFLGEAYAEGMSEEQISNAVEKAVTALNKKNEKELTNIKNAFNKASSEVADYKNQLREKMSDEEKAKSEQESLIQKLTAENEQFRKDIQIQKNKAELLAIGYSDELATETAEAIYNGDTETLFRNQKAVIDEREKLIRSSEMKATPVPPAGSGGSSPVTKASIMSVRDPIERQRLIAENIELFTNDSK